MASTYKVVFQFIDSNGNQWSELFYRNANSPGDALLTTGGTVTNRLKFLHRQANLVKMRAYDTANARVTASVPVNLAGTYPGAPTDDTSSRIAPPSVAIVCQLASSAGGARKIWCRGAPQDLISRGRLTGLDDVRPALADALQEWFASLGRDQFGIRRLQGSQQKYPLLSVTGDAPASALVTYKIPTGAVNPGWQGANPQSRVIIAQADRKTLPALDGHWSVLNVNEGTIASGTGNFRIRYQTAVPNAAILAQAGYVKTETYATLAVISPDLCGFDHYGTRSTKDPLSRSRGARRAHRDRTLS